MLQVAQPEPAVPTTVQVYPEEPAAPVGHSVAPVQLAPKPLAVSRPASAQDHASYYLQVNHYRFTCLLLCTGFDAALAGKSLMAERCQVCFLAGLTCVICRGARDT